MTEEDAFALLALLPGASPAAVKQAWRQAASRHHPDRGGDAQTFHRCREAYALALAAASRPALCPGCGGSGRVPYASGWTITSLICSRCAGSGVI